MQQKQNKGKAKREAKIAAKQSKLAIAPENQPPQIIALTNMLQHLQPAIRAPNDPREAIEALSMALTRLRLKAGNDQDISLIYGRLMLGRRIAHFHFNHLIAENLHHAVQTLVLTVNNQGDAPLLYLDTVDGDEMRDALVTIEQMINQLDHNTYLKEAFAHDLEIGQTTPELHLQDWEDYLVQFKPKATS